MPSIYKILPRAEWESAKAAGHYDGSVVDKRDGFIHFSTAEQAVETARRHFTGQVDLVVLKVPSEVLGEALKWEPSRGGELFPHLYGMLDANAVVAVTKAPLGKDGTPALDIQT